MDKLTISFYGALASTTAALTLIVVKVDMWLEQRRQDKALFGRNAIMRRMLEYDNAMTRAMSERDRRRVD